MQHDFFSSISIKHGLCGYFDVDMAIPYKQKIYNF